MSSLSGTWRRFGTREGRTQISPQRGWWRALVFAAAIVLALFAGSVSEAQAACDQTIDSTTGATINFTSTGQTYHLCFQVNANPGVASAADDPVLYGIYSASNIDASTFAPITGSSGSATPYDASATNASYHFVTTLNGGTVNFGQSGLDISINSVTHAGGQDTVTLWYCSTCSDANGASTSPAFTDHTYVLTINLPAAPPTVTAISPASGPAAGGTSVAITGTNFSNVSAVKFGTTNATTFTVNSPTSITATSPAGSGTVDVTVTTTGGTSATSGSDRFTYVPSVTSVSPTSGPTGGGTSVSISGSGFTGASAVKFGGTNATSFTVNSASSITATAPAGTGTVDVTVTNSGQTSATSAADQYTYIAAPTVSSISPTSGPGTGGTTVTITGTGFSTASAVTFGAAAATGFSVVSGTSITATAPAGSGTVDIKVTNPGGTSTTSAADQFTYIPSPTVTSLSPTSGPTAGGTTVTITGTNLTGATAVTFGGTSATFTPVSATSITATAPAGTGTVDVRVTTAGGTSAIAAGDQFTYAGPPTVTSVSPTSGPLAGGTTVTVTGTNFTSATAVSFGATPATSFSVVSGTSITATSPAGTGTVDIRVTTPGGTSAIGAGDQFTYAAAPAVTSISPTAGSTAGGTVVTITGSGFTGATAVSFGATPATSFSVVSGTSITATSPAGTGTVDIRVTTPGGTSAIGAADQFTYVVGPTVSSISPTSGPTTGGTTVTITGTGFTGATAVKFGTINATGFSINSATSITATAPAGTGIVDVTVTSSGGTSPTSAADHFTYAAAPAVTSVAPASGPTAGGTSVTITGTNFSGASVVKFGATNATSFSVNSATSITATSPAGTGTVDVTVTTSGGTSAIAAGDQFSYFGSPAVTSIAPSSGSLTGGTSVTITGTSLSGATAVKFGATNAASFTVNSATSIMATSPAGTGTVDVTVVTPGGTSATSAADQFTYVAGPTVTSVSPTSGPAAGGTPVAISGTGFIAATAVKFGTLDAAAFTVNSATSITATSPAGSGTVDITVTTAGGTSPATAADRFAYQVATTQTALSSSQNPSSFGQPVTFTATVTASGGTPAGTVNFNDGATTIGSAAVSGGVATFTTSTLAVGNHTITAHYAGNATFVASVSTALAQTVNIPADSVKLRAMQLEATRIVAQNSGQAISGAIDDAISEGFDESGVFIKPGQTSLRFNFAADPVDPDEQPGPPRKDGTGATSASAYGAGPLAGGSPPQGGRGRRGSRIDDAFDAIAQQMPRKAPPTTFREQKDWLFWIDVRGSGIDRWSASTSPAGVVTTTQSQLTGLQINALAGLTYRLRPDLLVGVVGGYEAFNFSDQDINGKLTGDGWTVGSYVGWKIIPTLRYDAAVAYSGIGYDGSAGTAQGNFNGQRWLVQTGLTGSYKAWGAVFEPSARVYALWENEGAYIDSLGTLQGRHDFATGRASAGGKVIYPLAWTDQEILFAPYLGVYGDYYFTEDDAAAIVATGGVPLASTPLLQGWSARMVAGIGARFADGGLIGVGAEYGGIGSDYRTWTVKARAGVPFAAR